MHLEFTNSIFVQQYCDFGVGTLKTKFCRNYLSTNIVNILHTFHHENLKSHKYF
jgi:hypothetical protein